MGSGTNSTILIVLGTMGLFFLLENLFPLRRQRNSLGPRLLGGAGQSYSRHAESSSRCTARLLERESS